MLAWCASARVQHAGLGSGKSLACQTRAQFSTPKKFGMPNSKSSMLDFLWGVQDSLGGAKARDFSRHSHSPLVLQLHEDAPCLV